MVRKTLFIQRILPLTLLFITTLFMSDLHAQIREAVESDMDYILSKFPYPKTRKLEKIYCKMYEEHFDCRIGYPGRDGMFPPGFNLADKFFSKLYLRPIGMENYNALNVAGLYLRSRRPGEGDPQIAYASIDIELDSLTGRVYAHNNSRRVDEEQEVKFKLAYLKLLEENLFLISDRIYTNELRACNNFEGPYYELTRKAVISVLHDMLEMEKNFKVRKAIIALLAKVPDEEKN